MIIIITIVDEVLGNGRGNRRCYGNGLTLQVSCSKFHARYCVSWGLGGETKRRSVVE